VAGSLAAEVDVEREPQLAHGQSGGDRLGRDRVVHDREAGDAIDVGVGESGVGDRPLTRLGRQREYGAARPLRELGVTDARDGGA
jgi:hypothetical protein